MLQRLLAGGTSMQHFAPHHSSQFEGFYSKFDLESGAHIALIICSVPKASTRPHMVSFTYYPADGKSIFQREHFISNISRITLDESSKAFELRVDGMGHMRTAADGTTSYDLSAPDDSWTLRAQSSSYTPWRHDKATPEGILINLPLPLHWHVHSLCSPATFTLSIPGMGSSFPASDHSSRATIHQEKNWASSFPDAHMWVQAWDSSQKRGICLAGGKILGQTAYMLGYRSSDINIDFIPPFSVSYLNLFSPFMSVTNDWSTRTFTLSVSNYFYKIDLKAQAPKEPGWFGLASPFPDGHRKNFCRESFIAEIEARISVKEGWWPWSTWREVRSERFEGASLEFAGGYYPERGERGGKEE